ncbi:MAG: S8 family serine peptidase [Oscillatoria sp. SIO1A7]|nr:S8 family serine peptidase [Oscillatoria sp. SIO1A7]
MDFLTQDSSYDRATTELLLPDSPLKNNVSDPLSFPDSGKGFGSGHTALSPAEETFNPETLVADGQQLIDVLPELRNFEQSNLGQKGDSSGLGFAPVPNNDPLIGVALLGQSSSTEAMERDPLTGVSTLADSADPNIRQAWKLATGKDTIIGIVDNGVQSSHPDLATNYLEDLSADFNEDFDSLEPGENTTTAEEQGWGWVWSPYQGGWLWRFTPGRNYRGWGWGWTSEPSSDPQALAPEQHGTAVAGITSGSGNNNEGRSGVAPDSHWANLSLTAEDITDRQIAAALSHENQEIDIYNNSWKPGSAKFSTPLSSLALEEGTSNGRDGLGNIYVFAGGNDGLLGENVNYNSLASSRYSIAVAAIDANGEQASYSEPGASLLVSAYSGSSTTDLTGEAGYSSGNYTDNFGGTSAAAALTSGVAALMLDANANLTWRDLQHIFVETAQQNDAADEDWTTNGAGYFVNHKYGFGTVDAEAAVKAALNWTPVSEEVSFASDWQQVNRAIPDYDTTRLLGSQVTELIARERETLSDAEVELLHNIPRVGNDFFETSSIQVADDINIEWVEVELDANHSLRGDLKVTLVSPDGTESVLADLHGDPGDSSGEYKWAFTSARHWGESSVGEWTLKVSDERGEEVGTWNSWKLNIHGT